MARPEPKRMTDFRPADGLAGYQCRTASRLIALSRRRLTHDDHRRITSSDFVVPAFRAGDLIANAGNRFVMRGDGWCGTSNNCPAMTGFIPNNNKRLHLCAPCDSRCFMLLWREMGRQRRTPFLRRGIADYGRKRVLRGAEKDYAKMGCRPAGRGHRNVWAARGVHSLVKKTGLCARWFVLTFSVTNAHLA